MSYKAELQLTLSTFNADGSLKQDELSGTDGKFTISAYEKMVNGSLQIIDTDDTKIVDLEGMTLQGFILKNKGGGAITYKFSDASADNGTLQDGSVIAIFNADMDQLSIETGNTTVVDYEYWVFG